MRRTYLFAAIAGAVAVAAVVLVRPASSPAAPKGKPPAPAAPVPPPAAKEPQLPIAKVVLFSSGVGYFQREGDVDGTQRINLTFPVTDVNDLLKSMVVRDLDGGFVTAVSYDSNAPVERTLKSFAIDLQGNPSFGDILNQARGERVEVVLHQANAAVTGTVVGIEKHHVPAGKDATTEVEFLNLWSGEGMRSLKLSEVQRVHFLNPVLDAEFRKALDTLASSHDTQKKAVGLTFTGEGKRRVRVGYVVENPIWKTSYRLILGNDQGDKPFLQGWAVVENPSDEDWKDARVALVSGRPISFQMDLYTPLFVPRPVVEPELFASLRPPTYNGDLAAAPGGAGGAPRGEAESLRGAARPPSMAKRKQAEKIQPPTQPVYSPYLNLARDADGKQDKALEQLTRGVESAATAGKLGDFFQYTIDKPVTLPRQKSALLPIVNKEVEGSRVSIYNERTQPKYPLLGLRFKNTSGLHLMQGPITVFEGASYAGDARILDLEPGEERLLAYAVDLGTEVNAVPSSDNGRITQIKIDRGILNATSKLREAKKYTVANRNDVERDVLIEHPVRNDFHLVDTDKPAETARDVYRFEVKVPAGKTKTQTVTEERTLRQVVELTNIDDNQIRYYLSQPAASEALKKALTKALELRRDLSKTQQEIAAKRQQLNAITDDQARLRANLKEVPPTAAAYKRYLEKFDSQETVIEKAQAEIEKLNAAEQKQRKEFTDYLSSLNVE
jgi:hypothetical protein